MKVFLQENLQKVHNSQSGNHREQLNWTQIGRLVHTRHLLQVHATTNKTQEIKSRDP